MPVKKLEGVATCTRMLVLDCASVGRLPLVQIENRAVTCTRVSVHIDRAVLDCASIGGLSIGWLPLVQIENRAVTCTRVLVHIDRAALDCATLGGLSIGRLPPVQIENRTLTCTRMVVDIDSAVFDRAVDRAPAVLGGMSIGRLLPVQIENRTLTCTRMLADIDSAVFDRAVYRAPAVLGGMSTGGVERLRRCVRRHGRARLTVEGGPDHRRILRDVQLVHRAVRVIGRLRPVQIENRTLTCTRMLVDIDSAVFDRAVDRAPAVLGGMSIGLLPLEQNENRAVTYTRMLVDIDRAVLDCPILGGLSIGLLLPEQHENRALTRTRMLRDIDRAVFDCEILGGLSIGCVAPVQIENRAVTYTRRLVDIDRAVFDCAVDRAPAVLGGLSIGLLPLEQIENRVVPIGVGSGAGRSSDWLLSRDAVAGVISSSAFVALLQGGGEQDAPRRRSVSVVADGSSTCLSSKQKQMQIPRSIEASAGRSGPSPSIQRVETRQSANSIGCGWSRAPSTSEQRAGRVTGRVIGPLEIPRFDGQSRDRSGRSQWVGGLHPRNQLDPSEGSRLAVAPRSAETADRVIDLLQIPSVAVSIARSLVESTAGNLRSARTDSKIPRHQVRIFDSVGEPDHDRVAESASSSSSGDEIGDRRLRRPGTDPKIIGHADRSQDSAGETVPGGITPCVSGAEIADRRIHLPVASSKIARHGVQCGPTPNPATEACPTELATARSIPRSSDESTAGNLRSAGTDSKIAHHEVQIFDSLADAGHGRVAESASSASSAEEIGDRRLRSPASDLKIIGHADRIPDSAGEIVRGGITRCVSGARATENRRVELAAVLSIARSVDKGTAGNLHLAGTNSKLAHHEGRIFDSLADVGHDRVAESASSASSVEEIGDRRLRSLASGLKIIGHADRIRDSVAETGHDWVAESASSNSSAEEIDDRRLRWPGIDPKMIDHADRILDSAAEIVRGRITRCVSGARSTDEIADRPIRSPVVASKTARHGVQCGPTPDPATENCPTELTTARSIPRSIDEGTAGNLRSAGTDSKIAPHEVRIFDSLADAGHDRVAESASSSSSAEEIGDRRLRWPGIDPKMIDDADRILDSAAEIVRGGITRCVSGAGATDEIGDRRLRGPGTDSKIVRGQVQGEPTPASATENCPIELATARAIPRSLDESTAGNARSAGTNSKIAHHEVPIFDSAVEAGHDRVAESASSAPSAEEIGDRRLRSPASDLKIIGHADRILDSAAETGHDWVAESGSSSSSAEEIDDRSLRWPGIDRKMIGHADRILDSAAETGHDRVAESASSSSSAEEIGERRLRSPASDLKIIGHADRILGSTGEIVRAGITRCVSGALSADEIVDRHLRWSGTNSKIIGHSDRILDSADEITRRGITESVSSAQPAKGIVDRCLLSAGTSSEIVPRDLRIHDEIGEIDRGEITGCVSGARSGDEVGDRCPCSAGISSKIARRGVHCEPAPDPAIENNQAELAAAVSIPRSIDENAARNLNSTGAGSKIAHHEVRILDSAAETTHQTTVESESIERPTRNMDSGIAATRSSIGKSFERDGRLLLIDGVIAGESVSTAGSIVRSGGLAARRTSISDSGIEKCGGQIVAVRPIGASAFGRIGEAAEVVDSMPRSRDEIDERVRAQVSDQVAPNTRPANEIRNVEHVAGRDQHARQRHGGIEQRITRNPELLELRAISRTGRGVREISIAGYRIFEDMVEHVGRAEQLRWITSKPKHPKTKSAAPEGAADWKLRSAEIGDAEERQFDRTLGAICILMIAASTALACLLVG